MKGMGPTKWAILLKSQFVWSLPFILGGRIIPVLATFTGQGNNVTHMKKFSIY
jgi:ABC-type proline/glycine betaine transport system permease subunit